MSSSEMSSSEMSEIIGFVNYDEAVADILQGEFPAGTVDIYHDRAPEVGDASYPFLVYRTLSVSPANHADNEMWSYKHNVRVTVVGKSESTKGIEDRVYKSMIKSGYSWLNTSDVVEDKQFGEKYVALDFSCNYWRY